MANEKRLIELETLIDSIDWDNDLQKWTLRGDPEDIDTVDAVEVVRCKDCTEYNGHRYCRYTELIVLDNDFCSYGERKDK